MAGVLTFLMPIVFSILLPSGDQGSDLYFWYTTVNFLGNSQTIHNSTVYSNARPNLRQDV